MAALKIIETTSYDSHDLLEGLTGGFGKHLKAQIVAGFKQDQNGQKMAKWQR